MLTGNGLAFFKINNNSKRLGSSGVNYCTLKSINGGEIQLNGATISMETMISSDRLCLDVGTNSTPVDVSDYAFTSDHGGLTELVSSGTNDEAAVDYTIRYIGIFSTTFINNTDLPITINEVGLIGYPDSRNKDLAQVLLAREVIDPVTIAPGESYSFTMTLG